MKNQFLTLRHKNGTILATIEEKCVTLANLQGEIYKQFPRQHFRPEDFPDYISFPGDYQQARAAFSRREAIKKAEAQAIAEAKRLQWCEERRQEILFVRKVRGMAFQSEEVVCYRVAAFDMELGRDGYWYHAGSTLSDDTVTVFFSEVEAAKQYEELRVKLTPSSSNESPVEVTLSEVHIDSADILDVTDYESIIKLLEEEDIYECLQQEILFPDYRSIEGAIYVEWAWSPYIGYARRFGGLHVGLYSDTERYLITGNEECTERTNRTLLLTAEDIADLSAEQLTEALEEELHHRNDWRWRCSTATIDNAIAEIVEDLKPEIP